MIKLNKSIELDEKQVTEILKEYIKKNLNQEVKSVRYTTENRGDHDRGTLTQHISTVYIKLK